MANVDVAARIKEAIARRAKEPPAEHRPRLIVSPLDSDGDYVPIMMTVRTTMWGTLPQTCSSCKTLICQRSRGIAARRNEQSGRRMAGMHVDQKWRKVLMRDPCVYCGGTPHGLDHIVPATKGGSDDWTNRAPACETCDQSKANASLLAFIWADREAKRIAARRTRYGNNLLAKRAAEVSLRKHLVNTMR